MATPSVSAPTGRLAVFGTLNVDLVWEVEALPRPGETVAAIATSRHFGGKGANQAVAAARQGAHVTLVGALGRDAAGDDYRAHLLRQGIDQAAVASIDHEATGTAHVYVDRQGANLIVVAAGANARADASSLDAVLPRVDRLLLQWETGIGPATDALRRAAAASVPVVLNPSPVLSGFRWGSVPVDTVIVNEHECAACLGLGPAGWLAADPASRRRRLEDHGITHLVITQGAEPTLHLTAAEVDSIATHPVQPRDTVGAGDTFAGALSAALVAGRPWREALRRANVAAALSTLELGAQAAMPDRATVEAVLAVS